jgi:hypothetical protein
VEAEEIPWKNLETLEEYLPLPDGSKTGRENEIGARTHATLSP